MVHMLDFHCNIAAIIALPLLQLSQGTFSVSPNPTATTAGITVSALTLNEMIYNYLVVQYCQ